MNRLRRVQFRPRGVPGLEQVGRDARPGTLPLPEHSHRGTEICLLASGEVVWLLGRRRMRLVGGMISVMQPGLAHRGEMDAIAPSDLYWTVLRPEELVPRMEPGLLRIMKVGRPYTAPAPPRTRALFDDLLAECAGARPGWRAATGALAALLALEAARAAPELRPELRRELPVPVAEAARLLAADLEAPPAIRELARAVGLGPTRFHALFKRAVGLTPRDYLGRLRLAEARRALAESREDVTALAIRLGYPSSQYFATVFRKHTGLTPTDFRRRSAP